MKKSGKELISRLSGEDNITDYYKEAALDSLLYWTNTTTEVVGVNATLTLLTEMLGTCIVHLVPVNQIDRAEAAILSVINQSLDVVRDENSAKVFSDNSDKGNMN